MMLCNALWITFEIHNIRSLGFLAFTHSQPFCFITWQPTPIEKNPSLCQTGTHWAALWAWALEPSQIPKEHHVFYHCKQILYLYIFRMCTTATSVKTNHFKFGSEKNIKLTTIWNTQNESVLVNLRRIYAICNIMQFDLYLLTQDLQVWNIQ